MAPKDELNEYTAKLGLSPEMHKSLMRKINNYTIHIAEQAVGEKRDARANRILSRIKQLTENDF